MSLFGTAAGSPSSKPALKIKKRLVTGGGAPENSQAARKKLEEEAARKRLEERREQELAELAQRDRLRRQAKAEAAKRQRDDDRGQAERSRAGPSSPSKLKSRKRLDDDDFRGSRSPSKKARSAAGTPAGTPSRSGTAYSDEEVDGAYARRKKIDVQQPISTLEGREYFDLEMIRGPSNPGWQGKIDSESVVWQNLKAYAAYFPQDEFAIERRPSVKLAYPAKDCFESFALLKPKHTNDYAPIPELIRTVISIVATFVPPERLQVFGRIPTATDVFSSASESLAHNAVLSIDSPRPSTPGTPTSEHPPSTLAADEDPIVRALHKAYNRKDGPGFVRAVERFNAELAAIRDSGEMEAYIRSGEAARRIKIEDWDQMAVAIGEQVYQRVVGPETDSLKHYEPFSDNVYGELLPRFVCEIIRKNALGKDSVFVDLGSGVGNAVIGVALLSGSNSYGCESMPNPSRLAALQITEAKRRWAMWGLKGSDECEVYQADFCEDPKTSAALRKADLVLVNNYAFTPALNDRLAWQFLDLKEGAKIISLKPFLTKDFRLTERTMASPTAVLRMTERSYPRNSVSWTDEGGRYFEHTIDRSALQRFMAGRGG